MNQINCPVCRTLLIENNYHRAINAGAKWYCRYCDAHLCQDLRSVRIACNCCAFDNFKEADAYNNKIDEIEAMNSAKQ